MATPRQKIVYLVNGPLTSRWEAFYCLDSMSKYFDVEYWDASQLIKFANIVTSPIERDYVHSNITYNNLEQELARLPKSTILVPELALNYQNFNLYKIISKYIHKVVLLDSWKSPVSFNVHYNIFETSRWKKENICHKIQKTVIKHAISFWWKHHFNTYTFSVLPNSKYRINYPDTETFYRLEKSQPVYSGRYVVYIGQYFPFHSDTLAGEGQNVIELASSFYKSMNHFFDIVEHELQCNVIIAEHPSACHDSNPYNGRQIIYYKTAELIKSSIAVCMHFSNSSSFVALYDKPVALIECDAIKKTNFFCRHNLEFARALGRKPVNVDNLSNVSSLFYPIDRTIRDKILSFLIGDRELISNSILMRKYFQEILIETD